MPATSAVAPATTFSFDSHTVRVIADSEHPLFVAKDVAEALGYKNTNEAIQKFCKGVAKRYPLSTEGGTQEVRVIEEPDVYRLIFGSKLESAQKFQNWVFEEVLPQIRKTGQYRVPTSADLPEPPRNALHIEIAHAVYRGKIWFHMGDMGRMLCHAPGTIRRHLRSWGMEEDHVAFFAPSEHGGKAVYWADRPAVEAFLSYMGSHRVCVDMRAWMDYAEACERIAPQPFRVEPQPPCPQLNLLPDGRYLLVVENGHVNIRDIHDKSLVDAGFTRALRRNFKTLSQQMLLLTGEADECVLDLQLQDLREVQP